MNDGTTAAIDVLRAKVAVQTGHKWKFLIEADAWARLLVNTLKRVYPETEIASALLSLGSTLFWLMIPVPAVAQTNLPPVDFGSVPTGTASNQVLHLTLRDAISYSVRDGICTACYWHGQAWRKKARHRREHEEKPQRLQACQRSER